jgi:hypothetical protein
MLMGSVTPLPGQWPQPASATEAREDPVSITLPTRVDPSTEQLLIGVDAIGKRLWCGLDTGFSALVSIDRTKAKNMGIMESEGQRTPDGNRPFKGDGRAKASLQVGPITMRDQPLIVRDFSPSAPDMDCVMGAALLREYVIEFDYAAGRVRLHAPAGFAAPTGAGKVPLIFRSNPSVPFVAVHVDLPEGGGRDLQTVVDTGCTYYALALAPPASTSFRQKMPTAAVPDHAATASGSLQLVASRPRRVTIGAFSVVDPVIALLDATAGLGGVDDGLLGLGFFRRFTVWVDFNGRAMYLRPNKGDEAPQLFDAGGVGFKRVADGYEVNAVLPNTPASAADIRAGDRLIAVDGQPALALGFAALRERLSRAGMRCELTLQRGDDRMVKSLLLKTRL